MLLLWILCFLIGKGGISKSSYCLANSPNKNAVVSNDTLVWQCILVNCTDHLYEKYLPSCLKKESSRWMSKLNLPMQYIRIILAHLKEAWPQFNQILWIKFISNFRDMDFLCHRNKDTCFAHPEASPFSIDLHRRFLILYLPRKWRCQNIIIRTGLESGLHKTSVHDSSIQMKRRHQEIIWEFCQCFVSMRRCCSCLHGGQLRITNAGKSVA